MNKKNIQIFLIHNFSPLKSILISCLEDFFPQKMTWKSENFRLFLASISFSYFYLSFRPDRFPAFRCQRQLRRIWEGEVQGRGGGTFSISFFIFSSANFINQLFSLSHQLLLSPQANKRFSVIHKSDDVEHNTITKSSSSSIMSTAAAAAATHSWFFY